MRIRIVLALLAPLLASGMALAQTGGDATYYSIALDGKRAGYSRYQVTPLGAGAKVTADTLIKLRLLGAPFDMNYQCVAEYERPGDVLPRRYTLTLSTGQSSISTDTRFRPGAAKVALNVNGAKSSRDVKLPQGCLLLEGNVMETWTRLISSLGSSKRKTVPIYAPSAGQVIDIALDRPGPGRLAIQIGGQTLEAKIDPKTNALLTLTEPTQKAVFTLADKTALDKLEGVEFASRVFATTDVSIQDPGALTSLILQVDAQVAGDKISAEMLQRPSQKFTGTLEKNRAVGRFEITRFRYDGADAAALPLSASDRSRFAPYLKPAAFVESDDPAIKELSAKLTANCKTTWEAARKIGEWVHQNIEYKITGSGARACLASKEGDCGPHSWLSIALLRAAGVPARLTGGAMYTGMLGGSFGQHYWTAVWTGDKHGWVPMDTTSGEIGVLSPSHLTLWDGTSGIGSLNVKVVSFAPKSKGPVTSSVKRVPLKLAAGQRWGYDFKLDGKQVGVEKVEIRSVSAADGVAVMGYAVELTLPQGKISAKGSLTLKPSGEPVSFDLDLNQAGISQSVKMEVRDPRRASVTIDSIGQKVARTADLSGGAYITMALAISPWDMLLRTLPWELGRENPASVYLADALLSRSTKFKAIREEAVKIGAESVPCLVLQEANAGQLFYIRKDTHELMRAYHPGAKLECVRRL